MARCKGAPSLSLRTFTSAPAIISSPAAASIPPTTARWSGVLPVEGTLAVMSSRAPAAIKAKTTSALPPAAPACSRVSSSQPRQPARPFAPAFRSFSTRSWLAVRAACSSGALSHSAHCSGVARSHVSLNSRSPAPSRMLARSLHAAAAGMMLTGWVRKNDVSTSGGL